MAYKDTVLTYGPIGYWPLDDASGNFADFSGNSRTMTVTGSPTYGQADMTGYTSGGSVDFTASPYAEVADAAWNSITGAFSICAWFRADTFDSSNGSPILEKYLSNNGYIMRISSGTPKLIIYTLASGGNDTVTGATTISASTVYFAVVTYDGTNGRVYLNGSLDAGPTAMRTPADNSNPLRMGARGDDATIKWDGRLQHVALWNRALSAGEITGLYTNTVTTVLLAGTGTAPTVTGASSAMLARNEMLGTGAITLTGASSAMRTDMLMGSYEGNSANPNDLSNRARIVIDGRANMIVDSPPVAPPEGAYVNMLQTNLVMPAPIFPTELGPPTNPSVPVMTIPRYRGRPLADKWVPAETRTNWGRLRVMVNNQDVTFYRGVPCQVGGWTTNEPFDDATLSLRFPQITGFEQPPDFMTNWWGYPPVELYVVRANLAKNPAFATDANADGLADDWGSVYGTGTYSIVAGHATSTAPRFVLTAYAGVSPRLYNKGLEGMLVRPNFAYTISGWIRTSVSADVLIGFKATDVAGTEVFNSYATTVGITANTWTKISMTGQMPATPY
jgi:hypothetical protein